MLRRTIVNRVRERRARLAWLAQAAADAPVDRFTADGRPLNAWLSRMIAKVTIAKLASLYRETEGSSSFPSPGS